MRKRLRLPLSPLKSAKHWRHLKMTRAPNEKPTSVTGLDHKHKTLKCNEIYNEATLSSTFCNNTRWCHLFPCKPFSNTSASTLPAFSDLLQ